MKARLRKLLSDLGETFWLLPATIVVAGILLAFGWCTWTAAAPSRNG
jgi:uncharacterized membrane protein